MADDSEEMADDSEDPRCFECWKEPGTGNRAQVYLLCQKCNLTALCSECAKHRRRCNICNGTEIAIHPVDTILRVAIGIRSFDTPINPILRALEFPEWFQFPLLVRTFWFSELYMTHFVVLAEAASGEWLQLQRLPHKELKTKGSVKEPGGVQLKPVAGPGSPLLTKLKKLKEGDELELEDGKPIIIVEIQRVEIERTRLNVFQETKGEKEYDWLTQNCQHLVYDFYDHFLRDRDRHDLFDFELWARELQDKYRYFAATPPQIDRQADDQMNGVEAGMPTFCGRSESHLLPAAV